MDRDRSLGRRRHGLIETREFPTRSNRRARCDRGPVAVRSWRSLHDSGIAQPFFGLMSLSLTCGLFALAAFGFVLILFLLCFSAVGFRPGGPKQDSAPAGTFAPARGREVVDLHRFNLLAERILQLTPEEIIAEVLQRQPARVEPALRLLRRDQIALIAELLRERLERRSVRLIEVGRLFLACHEHTQPAPAKLQLATEMSRLDDVPGCDCPCIRNEDRPIPPRWFLLVHGALRPGDGSGRGRGGANFRGVTRCETRLVGDKRK